MYTDGFDPYWDRQWARDRKRIFRSKTRRAALRTWKQKQTAR